MSEQFYFSLVLFDPLIGLFQVPPLRARVDLGAIAIKGYSVFLKAPALTEPHHQIAKCHIQVTRFRESYPSAEKQSVYSTDLTNSPS